jgi:large subunit ribosomal protein L10
MTVAELSELRNLLREGKVEYKIVKNTLAKIASEGTPVSFAKDSFRGPVGIAISYDDPVLPVKKILEYSKKNDKLKVSAGVIEGSVCSSIDLKAVAETPPRKVLLSMLAGGFQAPLNKMAYALNATLAQFVYVLEAIKSKKN